MRISDQLVEMVRNANPERSDKNVLRRLLKVLEELGEASEACLSVSSPHNYKDKSWADYREESADTLIVLIDIALTDIFNFPGAALVPPAITTASEHSVQSLDDLFYQKFKIAGAIAAAADHMQEKDYMGFLGAIMRGINAASNICFARIPEDNDSTVIAQRVLDIFEKKIDKWNNNQRQYANHDDGIAVQ